jgi:GGDEF domain-containing protein
MSTDAPKSLTSVTLSPAPAADIESLVSGLAQELEAVLPGIGVHVHVPEHGIEVNVNRGGQHQLSYRLRHHGTSLGEVTLRSRSRFSGADIERMESILARCMPLFAASLAELGSDASSDIDPDTGLQTRAALLRHMQRAAAQDCPTALLIVRSDQSADTGTLRRIALQLAAVLGDPDRAYRIGERTFAVTLYDAEAAAGRFLAERIRLMIAAMPVRLPAPTVTIALTRLGADEDGDETLDRAQIDLERRSDVHNRVITL